LVVVVFAVTAVVHLLVAASVPTTVGTAACIRTKSAHKRFCFLLFLALFM